MTSTLFESFMVFYLLEVLILVAMAFHIIRESKQNESVIHNNDLSTTNGPTPSDMIKMRAMAKEMERQSK